MAKNKIPDSEYIDAKCPKCQKIHRVHMDWTGGNFIPRVYCYNCKLSLGQYAKLKTTKVLI